MAELWVDSYLQLLVAISPGYIRDTKYAITIIDGVGWKDNYAFLSFDFTALYPSISHDLAIVKLSEYFYIYIYFTHWESNNFY